MFKEVSKGILALLSKGLKHRKQRNQHGDNYFQQGENPGGRPDPAGMALFLRYSNRGGRRGPRTHLCAAKATAVDTTVLRVSFPPNPPPILFTRTTILLSGTPNIFATKLYAKEEKKPSNQHILWTLSRSDLNLSSMPGPMHD